MRWLFASLALALPAGAAALTLHQAIEMALARDPQLAALEKERQAAEFARDASRAFLAQNPVLSVEAGPQFGENQAFAAYIVALEQPLELGGQGGARRAATDAAVERTTVQIALRRRTLASAVREQYAQAVGAAERERLAGADADFATRAAEVADARLAEGKLSRLARNAALVEQARALRSRAAASVESAQARAQLRSTISLPVDAPMEVEGTLAEMARRTAAPMPERVQRLELQEAQLQRDESAARANLADAAATPTLDVSASFERESGSDRLSAIVSIPLPLFDRNAAERATARTELARSQAQLVATERAVVADIAAARTRLDAARAAVDAFQEGALQALEENVALATEAFRAGEIGATEFIPLRREALEGRLAWLQALEELALAQIAWERAVGAP